MFGKDSGIPATWYNYSYSTYQLIGAALDKGKTGYVSFVQLATFLTLLQSSLPITKELAEYDMKLSVVAQAADCVTKDSFTKVEAWFDQAEDCAQREKAERFNRPAMIKELLFEINMDKEKVLLLRGERKCNKTKTLKI